MTFDLLQRYNRDTANPFDVVYSNTATYTASNEEIVITEGNTVELPSPKQGAIVGVKDNAQRVSVTSPSGQVHRLTEAYIDAEETVYFVSDGTDWYTISDSTGFGPEIPSGETVHYPFNGGVTDIIGNSVGTNSGATFPQGPSGAYAEFTGSEDDRIDIDISAFSPEEYTISLWVRWDDITVDGLNGYYVFDSINDDTRIYIVESAQNIMNTSWGVLFNDLSRVTQGAWYHIAIVNTGVDDDVKMYVNGNLRHQYSNKGYALKAPEMAFGYYNYAANSLDGGVDDFRIYSRVLTDAEILALYQWGTA